jgi:hypothetical protein
VEAMYANGQDMSKLNINVGNGWDMLGEFADTGGIRGIESSPVPRLVGFDFRKVFSAIYLRVCLNDRDPQISCSMDLGVIGVEVESRLMFFRVH